MTVPAQTPVSNHIGNGVTTTFPYTFLLFSESDLSVTVDNVAKVLGIDYTVTGLDEVTGGNVIFTTPPAALSSVALLRQVAIMREIDYQYSGDFQSPTVNRDFDRLVMMIQDSGIAVANALRFPPGDASDGFLPVAGLRALKVLGFDAEGNIVLSPTLAGDATALALELASSTTPFQGAEMVGFNQALTYTTGSVGAYFNSLASLSDAAKGAALLGYKLNATGAVGRTLASKLGEFKSIKDFGAVGDATTDDTAAIQAAVNAGVPLRVPAGVYKITAPIVISSIGLVSMQGEGQLISVFRASGNFSTMFNFTAASGKTNFWDVGFDTVATTTRAVTCTGIQHLFSGCEFTGSGSSATQPLAYVDSSFNRFEFCTFNVGHASLWALWIDSRVANTGPSGALVISNTIYQCFVSGIGKGLNIQKTQALQRPEGTEISSTQFLNTGTRQVVCANHYGLQCTGSLFQECSDSPVEVATFSDMTQFVGCTIAPSPGSTGSGIVIQADAGKGHLITGNTFRVGAYAVNVLATGAAQISNVTIESNFFYGHTSACLRLDSVIGCIVENNNSQDVVGAYTFGAVNTYGSNANKGSYVMGGNVWAATGAAFWEAGALYRVRDEINGPGISSRGAAAISPAATLVTIAHGLKTAPSSVRVTPNGNVGAWYVQNVDATNFQISWANNITCVWYWEANI